MSISRAATQTTPADSLIRWLKESGAKLNNVTLCSEKDQRAPGNWVATRERIGICATHGGAVSMKDALQIPASTIIHSIGPSSGEITSGSCVRLWRMQGLVEESVRLAIHLTRELAHGDKSTFAPYIKTLPPIDGFADTLFHANDSVFEEFHELPTVQDMETTKDELAGYLNQLLGNECYDGYELLNRTAFAWAFLVARHNAVRSTCMYEDGYIPCLLLVPLIDQVSFGRAKEVNSAAGLMRSLQSKVGVGSSFNPANGFYTLWPTRPLKPHTELLVEGPSISNDKLYGQYNMMIENNPYQVELLRSRACKKLFKSTEVYGYIDAKAAAWKCHDGVSNLICNLIELGAEHCTEHW